MGEALGSQAPTIPPGEEDATSSRNSTAAAGWDCAARGGVGSYRAMMPPERRLPILGLRRKSRSASWMRPSVLWRTRNDVVARLLGDPTESTRRRWLEHVGADPRTDLAVRPPPVQAPSFVLMGDPGEGDASQYAVVPALRTAGAGTDFMVIVSDVIYPAGESNDYVAKFAFPYRDYPAPIYALPGNHDWYDGLDGFMRVFCQEPGDPPLPKQPWRGGGVKGFLHRLLWRQPSISDPVAAEAVRALRDDPAQRARQPAPYFMIDLEAVRLVCIDTGIRGVLDEQQGAWLRRISSDSPKPKVLLTGKPLLVDGTLRPGQIEGGGTVEEIVRAPGHNYVMTVGGDIHNYQRYPVPVSDGRGVIQYVVSGGGGAFMHATHRIKAVDVSGVAETDFRCYPLRGDSLSFYSHLIRKRLLFRWLPEIPPDEAAALMGRRLGITPSRVEAGDTSAEVKVRLRSRFAAFVIGLLPPGPVFHRYFSEFFDWNEPPLFKSFLRLSVSGDELRCDCCAATGCADDERDPPVEDSFAVPLRSV